MFSCSYIHIPCVFNYYIVFGPYAAFAFCLFLLPMNLFDMYDKALSLLIMWLWCDKNNYILKWNIEYIRMFLKKI